MTDHAPWLRRPARHLLLTAAATVIAVAACASAAGPDASVPIAGGRGGEGTLPPASAAPSVSSAPTAAATQAASPVLSTQRPSDRPPMATLEEFRTAFAAFDVLHCDDPRPSDSVMVVECTGTHPGTETTFLVRGTAKDGRLDLVSVVARPPSGTALDEPITARTFADVIEVVTADATHPAVTWVRERAAEIGASSRQGDYFLTVLRHPGESDPTRGRYLVILLPADEG